MASDNRERIEAHSKMLAKLGMQVAKMRFSYKVNCSIKQEYWEGRISDHKKYFEKGQEYYDLAYRLIKLVDAEQAGIFLMMLSKFAQLKTEQMKALENIRQNPTVMKTKDKQQSRWSKNAREEIVASSNRCLDHEKTMSRFFSEFFDRHMRKRQDAKW